VISRNGSAVNSRSMAARDREDAVVDRLHDLAPHLDGEPDPAFREATRARLVAMAAVRSPEPEPVSPLRRLLAARASDVAPAPWRARLTAGLAGAALTVTALSTLVALSDGARPGDVLYGLKRGTEQTQLALAGDSRGHTLLDFASTRLGELQYLVSEDAAALPAAGAPSGSAAQVVLAAGADPELVIETLDTMDAQTTEGAAWLAERAVTKQDAAPLEDLASWTSAQTAGLSALQADVPGEAQDALADSLALLADVGSRAAGLLPVLDCSSGPATDGVDELGPVPGSCEGAAPTPPVPGGEPGTAPGTDGPAGGTSTDAPSGGSATEVPGSGSGRPGSGSGGGTSAPGGGVPGEVPSGGGLPTPSVPVPTVPPVTVPSITVPLPGTQSGGSTGAPQPSLDVEICVGPIQIGTC
jgi:hypothetical protein